MSNTDATMVMGVATGAAGATVQMPAGGDAFRTQMGGTTTCPVCKSSTPLMDAYCGDCGYLLSSPAVQESILLPTEEAPAAELVDEANGRRYRLRLGVNSVGRQGTDVLSTEATVSRNHATVTVSENSVLVEDLGSSNGTKVGDVRLQANVPVKANPGEIVRFGTWKLMLAVGAATQATGADQTIVVPLDEKTIVLSSKSSEPASESVQAAASQDAPAIAVLSKLEGICDDIRIPEGMMSLGRKAGNALVLADPYLSSRHAELFAEPSGVYLVDLASTNGTYVNGQRLEPNDRQLLLDGDEVQLGQTKYRFSAVIESKSEVAVEATGSIDHVASLDETGESGAE